MAHTGVLNAELAGQGVVLDHGQHDGGGAHLQEGRDLGQVGVAHDDVQAPVLGGVAVRLVAGVDDRALERGLEPDLLLEEVGPLGELERHLAAGRAPAASLPTLPAPVKIWRVMKWASRG